METPQPKWLAIERLGSQVILRIHRSLDSEATPMLEQRLADLVDGQGNLDVVIDLRAVPRVDHEAVGVLAGATDRISARGGRLVLSGPNQDVDNTLRRSGLRTTPG